jgi:hypothetical protein
MPPLTATSKPLEPVVLTPTASVNDPRDAWIEKALGPRERQTEAKHKRLEPSRARAADPSCTEDDEEEHIFREMLEKYIAEATADLNDQDEELFDDSDSDEGDEPMSTSPCSDVFDCESECADDYVEPPVEVPCSYRAQDLQGGLPVGGDYVLFTSWAFKRQQRRMKHLRPIPERRDAGEYELPPVDDEKEARGVYTGKIVEL